MKKEIIIILLFLACITNLFSNELGINLKGSFGGMILESNIITNESDNITFDTGIEVDLFKESFGIYVKWNKHLITLPARNNFAFGIQWVNMGIIKRLKYNDFYFDIKGGYTYHLYSLSSNSQNGLAFDLAFSISRSIKQGLGFFIESGYNYNQMVETNTDPEIMEGPGYPTFSAGGFYLLFGVLFELI